jgi:mannose-6-phosphate isomerase-like protein (cupin superfamily)
MPDTAATVRDPVHRAAYAFEPDGENLWVDTWLEPGGALPHHLHPNQDEIWSVVEGEARFLVGRDKRVVRPADGDVPVPAGTKHGIESASDRVAHLRCHVRPARGLQAFLEDSAAAAREGLFMRGGIPKSLKGARWAAGFLAQHRDDVVMTFPPRPVQSAMIALLGRR